MSDSFRKSSCPDFSEALIAAKETGEIELAGKIVGKAFQRSADTGEDIINGAWDVRLKELRRVLFSPLAKTFLSWLTCGTDWMAVKRPGCGDIDGNGRIEKSDVLHGAIQVAAILAEQLEQIHRATAGRGYTPHDAARINQLIGDATGQLGRMGRAVNELTITTA